MPFDRSTLRKLRKNDPSLTEIWVRADGQTTLTDGDIQQLVTAAQGNQHLKKVWLHDHSITSLGAERLATLPLEDISLSGNKIDYRGIAALASMQTLKALGLSGNTDVTDACIGSLVSNTHLEYLSVTATSVTVDGLRQLLDSCSLSSLDYDEESCNGELMGLIQQRMRANASLEATTVLTQPTGPGMFPSSTRSQDIRQA